VQSIVATLRPDPWVQKKVVIEEDKQGDEKKTEVSVSDDDHKAIDTLKASLGGLPQETLKAIVPVDFEKDDDKNHHIDWITSSTNLRSFNYFIKPSTRATCRLTAGRIIPAIATTTACITGFVQLEIFKHVLNKPLLAYRSATIDLAVNTFVLENLPDPIKIKSDNKEEPVFPATGYTVWDKVVVDRGDLTLEEFVKAIPEIHFGVQVHALFKQGVTENDVKEGRGQALYMKKNPYAGQFNMAKQMLQRENLSEPLRLKFQKQIEDHDAWAKKFAGTKRLLDQYVETYGPLPTADRNYVLLEGTFEDNDMNHSRIPVIKYIFKKASN